MAIELTSILALLATCAVVGALVGPRTDNWDHPRRCTANKTDGSGRCTHYALRGGTVCKYHGGNAPQVLRAAAVRRMSDLYGPMLAGLRGLLDSGDLDSIAKACAILARQYGNDVDAKRLPDHSNASADTGWIEWLTSEELHELSQLQTSYRELARERMEAGIEPWRANRDVIDVVPVKEGDDAR